MYEKTSQNLAKSGRLIHKGFSFLWQKFLFLLRKKKHDNIKDRKCI